MTTPPITASVSEPTPIPERPTLYMALYPFQGGWERGSLHTDPSWGTSRVPGSVLVTIPGSTSTPASVSGDGPYMVKGDWIEGPGVQWRTGTREQLRCGFTAAYAAGFAAGAATATRPAARAEHTPSGGSGEEVAWLIERGQPEGQHPPCWLKCNGSQDGYEWVYDANDATKYPTKNAANSALVARSGIANVHSRWAHVTEHVFISQPPPTPDLRAVATTLVKALDEYLDVLDNAPEESSTSEIRYARSLARTALETKP